MHTFMIFICIHSMQRCAADLIQSRAVVGQGPRARAPTTGETGGAVSTSCGRGVARELVRRWALLALGPFPAAVGQARADPGQEVI